MHRWIFRNSNLFSTLWCKLMKVRLFRTLITHSLATMNWWNDFSTLWCKLKWRRESRSIWLLKFMKFSPARLSLDWWTDRSQGSEHPGGWARPFNSPLFCHFPLLGKEERTMSRLHPKPDRYLSEVYCDYPLALGLVLAVLHGRNASLAIERWFVLNRGFIHKRK